MVLGKLRNRSAGRDKARREQPRAGGGTAESGLAAALRHGITLGPDRVATLKEALQQGLEFFERFNESRLELAFTSFDEDMRKALYEVLYLLHVNDPALAEWKFTGIRQERKGGVARDVEYEGVADLYVEDAPHGVMGIGELSPLFRDDFDAYVREVFGQSVSPQSAYGFCPIYSVHSLGSIGTVGHKSHDSDLDLQVQYELEPYLFDPSSWSDQTFKEALQKEREFWVHRLRQQHKLPPDILKDPKAREQLLGKARAQLVRQYPTVTRFLSGNQNAEVAMEAGVRGRLIHELMQLMKRHTRLVHGEELKKREKRFRERLGRIQQYLLDKYPHAEVYLFTASNDDYRRGYHGTTLENKEASGSAYQLILNYETLMPGIQITPMVPSHFVVPQFINDDPARYDRIMDYIRFNALDLYGPVRQRVVNLGAVPDLPLEYVAGHSGAVYWEAFKASSGNLPKAFLNLLRFEMLLDPRFLKTIIQLIKQPTLLNPMITPKAEHEREDVELMVKDVTGIPNWALLELEEKFPLLLQDPWWQRYKALKIGYGEPNGVPGLEPEERHRLSKVIDLAFALHVRVSDVFTKPGDTRKFETHREQFLVEFLRRAFPPVSPRRQLLEHLFIGEVRAVNHFESELRDLFKRSLGRTNDKLAEFNVQGEEGNRKEFEIWYHYYQQNFEPAPNVVQRTIMSHLKKARGRLLVGYRNGRGWWFRSLQRESGVGKRFDTFGTLEHLPDEVDLLEDVGFLYGLAHCIVNGYYGIVNRGTLREQRTVLEFDSKSMDLGNRIDNTLAFIRPDQVGRILDGIMEFFPYQPYHYMDCIRLKRSVTEVYVFVNLLKFGRVSILYRDNLRTWYCDDFEHPDVFKQAQRLRHNVRELLMARSFHMTLARFFKSKGVRADDVSLSAWVNPNSVETNHSAGQVVQKERELAEQFVAVVRRVHAPREAPASAAGAE